VSDTVTRTDHSPLEYLLITTEKSWQALAPAHRAAIMDVVKARAQDPGAGRRNRTLALCDGAGEGHEDRRPGATPDGGMARLQLRSSGAVHGDERRGRLAADGLLRKAEDRAVLLGWPAQRQSALGLLGMVRLELNQRRRHAADPPCQVRAELPLRLGRAPAVVARYLI